MDNISHQETDPEWSRDRTVSDCNHISHPDPSLDLAVDMELIKWIGRRKN